MRIDVFPQQMSSVIVKDNSIYDKSIHKKPEKSIRSRQPQDISSEKNRNNYLAGLNRRYIVSPFRIQKGFFDFKKSENVDEDSGVNCKSLTYFEESVEEKTLHKEPSKNDLPNTAVRWRITIRQQRANMDSEVTTTEVVKNS